MNCWLRCGTRPLAVVLLGLALSLAITPTPAWAGDATDTTSQAASVETVPADRSDPAVTFENDVQPLLTRFGCNAGACHGKARGQNGFALSLLGFDSDMDHDALVRAARGRRVVTSAPDHSLLLLKATGQVPHGGGQRFDRDSAAYELIRRWIADGAPRTPADAPRLERVEVRPTSLLLKPHQVEPLHVIAHYSDGRERDVTETSAYQSNEQAIADVDPEGRIHAGPVAGEAAVMVRYMNHIAVCNVAIPLEGEVPDEVYARLPREHRVDQLVWDKLQLLGIVPSGPADDATFARRAYLRVIGKLPTVDELRAFLADESPDKRSRLVDQLLERPEYADFWANKWADLLRPNPYRVGIKAVWTLDAWLRDAMRRNQPYDEFVRELVTAQGSTWQNGATVVYRDRSETVEIASMVSQIFLGVRLECAKCHHHPFEVWSQDDFYGFAAFFARVGHNGGISPPISGGEELIYTATTSRLKHVRTGETPVPRTLTGESLADRTAEENADEDPREALADWMTDPANPFFAKVMVNRVWAELMGRGIVEPVDDLRATNPPSNAPLLDYLADEFRSSGYDVKHLIRVIMKSQVFGLASAPNERNASDVRNYSRYYRQRLRAEVLLDAVNDILDVEEEFAAMPPGSRAMQLWTFRSPSLFLDTFGRPDPNLDPPCERTFDTTTPQSLHLMNSAELNRKLSSDDAVPARWAASDWTYEKIVEEAYLRIYCRPPRPEEAQRAVASLERAKERRQAIEDLIWAMLNTPEFLFIQ